MLDIKLTQDEVNAFNIISAQAAQLQAQLNQTIAAQKAYIALIENKYDCVHDPMTGLFKPKDKK